MFELKRVGVQNELFAFDNNKYQTNFVLPMISINNTIRLGTDKVGIRFTLDWFCSNCHYRYFYRFVFRSLSQIFQEITKTKR